MEKRHIAVTLLLIGLAGLLAGCKKEAAPPVVETTPPTTEMSAPAPTGAGGSEQNNPGSFTEYPDAQLSEDGYYYVVGIANEATIVGRNSTGANMLMPDYIEGCPVTAIAEGAFYKDTALQTVRFPVCLRTVGRSAFEGCTSLETVTSGGSLDYGERTYYGCSALTQAPLGYGIGDYCFYGTHVSGGNWDGVYSIGSHAFAGTDVEEISLGQRTYSIADHAFSDCQNLTYAKISWYTREIGEGAFENCSPELIIEAELGSAVYEYATEAGLPIIIQADFR